MEGEAEQEVNQIIDELTAAALAPAGEVPLAKPANVPAVKIRLYYMCVIDKLRWRIQAKSLMPWQEKMNLMLNCKLCVTDCKLFNMRCDAILLYLYLKLVVY